jgi:hypothetical protein
MFVHIVHLTASAHPYHSLYMSPHHARKRMRQKEFRKINLKHRRLLKPLLPLQHLRLPPPLGLQATFPLVLLPSSKTLVGLSVSCSSFSARLLNILTDENEASCSSFKLYVKIVHSRISSTMIAFLFTTCYVIMSIDPCI